MLETVTEEQLFDLEMRPSRFRRLENRHEVGLTLDERDALCRSLRAAWAKYERLKSKIAWHRDGTGPDVPVLLRREIPMQDSEFDADAFDNFLRTDPSVQYVLQNAAAEKRLRERDGLPQHLDAVVVGYGGFRWIKIIDDNGTSHIEQV